MAEGWSMSTADLKPDVHPGPLSRRDWWKSAVVYQIYPRSFADSTVTASATSAES